MTKFPIFTDVAAHRVLHRAATLLLTICFTMGFVTPVLAQSPNPFPGGPVGDLQAQVLILQSQITAMQTQLSALSAPGFNGSISVNDIASESTTIDKIFFDLTITRQVPPPTTVETLRKQESFTATFPDLNNPNNASTVAVKTHNDDIHGYVQAELVPLVASFSFTNGQLSGSVDGIQVSGAQLLTASPGNISSVSLPAIPAISSSNMSAEELTTFLGPAQTPAVSLAANAPATITFVFFGANLTGIAYEAFNSITILIHKVDGGGFRKHKACIGCIAAVRG
jgi:hypothetical protein